MSRGFLVATILLLFSVCRLDAAQRSYEASDFDSTWTFSVLTCTPGEELYSTFGHSAIRIQHLGSKGHLLDLIYNYGTFDGFQEGFYLKFARGKLDYSLSRYDFKDFYHEYITENRGISEQILDLSAEEKFELFQLLDENYKPENRNYRYDFFLDNCATRIEQILRKATNGRLNIVDPHAGKHTFREAIQPYLEKHPWSDYGIDLALGLPCDRTMKSGQSMFLPDSVYARLSEASNNNKPFVIHTEEILFAEPGEEVLSWFTPMKVNLIWMLVVITAGLTFWVKKKNIFIAERITFFVTGLVGLMIVFLWFFTDHTATAYNFNLIWANPIILVLAFLPIGRLVRWRKYLFIYLSLMAMMLLTWFILPQKLHLAVIPLTLALLFSGIRILKYRTKE